MPNSWICIDANCVIQLILQPDGSDMAPLWDRWVAEDRQFAAPILMRFEITNALYRYQRHGVRTAAATTSALRAAIALPIQLHDESELHQQAMDIATRFNLPAAYDAHYLALADRLDAEFWTADKRLANTVTSALPWVHLVGE